MNNKNEKEREELHKTIWRIAEGLRGSVDGWDFKNYVLGTMFYRYLSENITYYINKGEMEAGNNDFKYENLKDSDALSIKQEMVEEKGFFILPSQLFCNVVKKINSNDKMFIEDLNENLQKIFKSIESSSVATQAEQSFKGLFDDYDVDSNKLGATVIRRNENLVKLLNGVANMQLNNLQDNSIDAFGDAYEYLMGMYAANGGKSGGEYYTPTDVSILLTKLGTIDKKALNKVYDPACGSGSLLLSALKVLGKDSVKNGFYGQEKNITTYNLCRINMFLHDVGYDKFNIACEDTLTEPQHWDDEPFDLIVSNPPYALKWDGDANPTLINDPRFSPAGVLAPKGKADFAFIMHSLSWLAEGGVASIVCFPGIMYRSGAEQKIRKYLIDNNYIDAIIQLPSNLFFGTSIATCILVLKKGKKDNKTLFIDASKEFDKVTNNNKLKAEHIENIVNYYKTRDNIDYISYLATGEDIANNDYNLSVSTYVEVEDTREKIDIKVLNDQIKETVSRIEELRKEIDKIVAEIEGDSIE